MAELKHRKCKGVVSIDIAEGFSLRTHSLAISPSEVRLGVLELTVKTGKHSPKYVCSSCNHRFSFDDDLEGMVAMCLMCSKDKPVSEIYTSFPFPCICEDCKSTITGKPARGQTSELGKYFNLSLSSIEFTPFVNLLKKPLD